MPARSVECAGLTRRRQQRCRLAANQLHVLRLIELEGVDRTELTHLADGELVRDLHQNPKHGQVVQVDQRLERPGVQKIPHDH